MKQADTTPHISIILPCLNEEQSIDFSLKKVKEVIDRYSLSAEVIVVDNGSTDGSAEKVLEETQTFPNLILITEPRRGYGSAYQKGIQSARGNIVIMADIDGTYDFSLIPTFLEKLDEGFDLVIGNRFNSGLKKRSMPFLRRRLGNPFLSLAIRSLYGINIRDSQCGMRAFRKVALDSLGLKSIGMEFASEMIIKAARANLRMAEVHIPYDVRIGTSKLNPFRDGMRHLRLIVRERI